MSLGTFQGHLVSQVDAKDMWGKDVVRYSVVSKDGATLASLEVVPFKESVRVKYAEKEPTAGFHMTDFYKWLLSPSRLGSLYSDPTQTPAGEKIWDRLASDGEVTIEEYEMAGGMMGGRRAVLTSGLEENLLRGWIKELLLTEAAAGPEGLSSDVIVVIGKTFNGFRVHYAPADDPSTLSSQRDLEPAGEVEVEWITPDEAHGTGPYVGIGIGECGGAGVVTESWASPAGQGWGKILYDVAMEYATLHGGGLISDRGSVSSGARGMWRRYLRMSGEDADVTKHQLKKFDPEQSGPGGKDDCLQHSSTYEPNIGGIPKNVEWTESPLSKRYTKEPTTISMLKSMGKLVGS